MSHAPDPDERPPHPLVIALVAVLGVFFVGWAIAPLIAEFVGAYLR